MSNKQTIRLEREWLGPESRVGAPRVAAAMPTPLPILHQGAFLGGGASPSTPVCADPLLCPAPVHCPGWDCRAQLLQAIQHDCGPVCQPSASPWMCMFGFEASVVTWVSGLSWFRNQVSSH